jgi:hypothetical protein
MESVKLPELATLTHVNAQPDTLELTARATTHALKTNAKMVLPQQPVLIHVFVCAQADILVHSVRPLSTHVPTTNARMEDKLFKMVNHAIASAHQDSLDHSARQL